MVTNIRRIYNLTAEILKSQGKYLTIAERGNLTQKFEMLGDIIMQVAPKLRSIFLPEWDKRTGRTREPPRWTEPRVRAFLDQFFQLSEGAEIPCNDIMEQDTVYQQVINPKIKELFRQRRGAKIYQTYLKYYEAQPQLPTTSKALVSQSHSLVIQPSRELLVVQQRERLLDQAPPEIVALEAGISLATTKRWQEKGLSGSKIVDTAEVIRDRQTTSAVTTELDSVASLDDWEDLIDTARKMNLPVKQLCSFLPKLEPEEIYGLADEFESLADVLALRYRRPIGSAWWVILTTYARCRSLDKTWDILQPRPRLAFHKEIPTPIWDEVQ